MTRPERGFELIAYTPFFGRARRRSIHWFMARHWAAGLWAWSGRQANFKSIMLPGCWRRAKFKKCGRFKSGWARHIVAEVYFLRMVCRAVGQRFQVYGVGGSR